MQLPDLSSQSWSEYAKWILGGGVITGLLAALNAFWNRKRPGSEVAKIDAEAEQIRANVIQQLSQQIVVLHDKLNLMEANFDIHEREHIGTIKYYRTQLEYFERLDYVNRNRIHAVNGELNRLGLAIRALELTLAGKGDALEPVVIRGFDDIVAPHPLPEPPAQ